MKKLFTLNVLAAILLLASCGTKTETAKVKGEGYFKSSDFDTTVAAGDNFSNYVNGSWLKSTKIPSTEGRWGSFSEVDEARYKILHDVMEESAADKNAKEGSNRKKVGDFYASGMDSVKLNGDGIKPVQSFLDEIDGIKTKEDLLNLIAKYHRVGTAPSYSLVARQDPKISSKMILAFYQSGLGLPDRDYYFRPDTASQSIRDAYVQYVKESLMAIGYDENKASASAKNIMMFETSLAEKSMGRLELRDPDATYHKLALSEFQKLTPDINWTEQLSIMKVPAVDSVLVGMPEFFKFLNSKIKSYPIEGWKDILKYDVISSAAAYLDDESAMRSFNFYSKKLSGVQEPKPRWKRVMNTSEGVIGEALGQEYITKAFSEESKKRMLDIIENLRGTFRDRIQKLDWMSDATKSKAVDKLNRITLKIGYPDKWKDYSALNIDRSSYFGNVLRSGEYEFQRNIDKLGKPVDRTEWGMNVFQVNAYYNPSNNEIVFPAGILQPPFFGPDMDDASIYGGIGAVICHEMSHGFDDKGAKFDADGNLKNWWSTEDSIKFRTKTKMVVDQFTKFTVLDGLPINGELTQGENIADLGGIMIALDAFKKSDEFKKGEKIDGYTPLQRFYLNWARVWRTKYTDAALRQQILTNPHSPGEFRCNGPITNTADWYEAFNITDKNSMFVAPESRIAIW